jgi:hypothetical protein
MLNEVKHPSKDHLVNAMLPEDVVQRDALGDLSMTSSHVAIDRRE